jgi:NADPH:quinone reductase-like Zn-dependent oxidoreductase
MKAIGTRELGSLSSLSLMEIPHPDAAPGEVRLRVHASSVNPADIKVARWNGPARFLHAKVSPLIPGYDFSGVVDQLGAGVEGLSVGDAVFGHLAYGGKTTQGTFAERVTIAATAVAVKPEGVEHATAAAAATVGLTALQALRDQAGVSSGSRLLVLGASGGVGSLAVGIGKRLGAQVTGLCSSYAVDFVRDLGADEVVDRKKSDPLAQDRPFDVVFDTTGLYAYSACRKVLTGSGTFVTTLPSASFVLGKLATLLSSRRCALVMVQSRRDDLTELGSWLLDGLPVPIAERLPVRKAAAALERAAQGGLRGKIAIDVVGGF